MKLKLGLADCSSNVVILIIRVTSFFSPGNTRTVVAFNAYISKDLRMNRNTPINVVYDALYFNHGNAFNPQSGFFVAPSDGLYVFTWTSFVDPRKIFDSEIRVNGKDKGRANCNNENNSGNAHCSNTVPLILKSGDKVNIRTTHANNLHHNWSNFKGWKI